MSFSFLCTRVWVCNTLLFSHIPIRNFTIVEPVWYRWLKDMHHGCISSYFVSSDDKCAENETNDFKRGYGCNSILHLLSGTSHSSIPSTFQNVILWILMFSLKWTQYQIYPLHGFGQLSGVLWEEHWTSQKITK